MVIGGTGVLCGRMCHALAKAGAHVVVAGRSAEKGNQRVQEIEQDGGKASFLTVDVSSRESIQELFDQAVQSLGHVDILINGAGVNSAEPFFDIQDKDWNAVLQTNLTSIHQACQIFGRHMTQRKFGSIINVASISSLVPLSKIFAYAASKAAVVNYTQNVAREFAPHGVRVNAISPGFFPAEQNRAILDKERVNKIMARTPMDRFGEPHELDGAILLLASSKAGSFVTGTNLIVDGGFSATSI